MNAFVPWTGGKSNLRDEIVRRFPPKVSRYVEVFGGAGWVLFHKEPSPFEVYNDFNSNLVTLFRVVREQPEKLLRQLDFCLNSREEFEQIKVLFDRKVKMPDVVRAANFFRLIRMSYGSKCVSFSAQPCDLERGFPAIRLAHSRLRDVIIENRDFEEIIRHYDRPDTLFYCDPPYYGTEDYYLDVGFTVADHLRLRDALMGIQGRFLLSYNDCPEIRELYDGYQIVELTRQNNMAQRYVKPPPSADGTPFTKGGYGAEYAELLIANYDMGERGRQNEQLSIFHSIAPPEAGRY